MLNYSREYVSRIELPAQMPMSQTSVYERKVFYWLASEYYKGLGDIVDAGCLVGGSTFHFLRGLCDNPNVINKNSRVHAYDYFPGTNYVKFMANLKEFEGMYVSYNGKLENFSSPEKVEILFIDIAKTISTWRDVCRIFFDRLIPECSVVYQQDFCRPRLPWQYYSTGYLLNLGKISIVEPNYMSFFFVLNEELSQQELARLVDDDFSVEEKLEFMDILADNITGARDTLGTATSTQFTDILSLSKAYIHHYWGDKQYAIELATDLCGNSFLLQYYSWMFGELAVEGFPAYHYRIAGKYFAEGNYDLARAENERAIENAQSGKYGIIYTPYIHDLYFLHSKIMSSLNMDAEAKRYAEAAISSDKTNPKYHYYLGVLLKKQGDLEAAEEAFAKAKEYSS